MEVSWHSPNAVVRQVAGRGRALVARRALAPGDTIMDRVPPYTFGIDHEFASVCHYCLTNRDEESLQRCSRCREARYCNRECQRQGWAEHKADCAIMTAMNASKTSSQQRWTRSLRMVLAALGRRARELALPEGTSRAERARQASGSSNPFECVWEDIEVLETHEHKHPANEVAELTDMAMLLIRYESRL